MGVVVTVYRFHHNYLSLTPLVLALFLQNHPYFFIHFCKCFFVLVYVIFVQYSKRCSKNISNCSNNEIMPTWRYNYINMHIDYESRDFQV